ncbi:MAG: 4Fe-4S binding protein [Acidimicrobiia bacterium]|nr:4Fe-4S binding protein [Acidimicrobiia bacterium]
MTLRVERPVNRALGTASLNPLHHTGTLAVLFFVVVSITGIYLTAFFSYGFVESYDAVARLEANLMGRFMRALHRYGSVALVIVTVLHGWRAFVQDRFRGARWLAWVTGIVMLAMLWVIGVTGYWLLWDERAQALNEILISALRGTASGLDFLLDSLLTPAAGSGWPFLLIVFLIHLFLSIAVGGFLVIHVIRLTPRQWFPPKAWTVTAGGVLVLLSLVWPVGLLPAFDGARIPASFPIDPFYLFLFPLGLNFSPWVVFGALTLLGVAVAALPLLGRSTTPPAIVIDEDRCTGCTLCVADCPYGALEMIPREDGKHRQLAVLVPDRCVSCGVCIGSCTDDALSLPEESIDETMATVVALAVREDGRRIVVGCERHLDHAQGDPSVHIVPVNCAGVIHPHLAERALDAGVADIQIVGCAPADCANRFGNTYDQERLDRSRVPRLKRRYTDAPIVSDWIPSIDIGRALEQPGTQPVADPTASPSTNGWVRLSLVTLALAAITIALTNLPFTPGFTDQAVVSIAMDHQGGAALVGYDGEPELDQGAASRLVVSLDGAVVLDQTYPTVRRDGLDVSQALERIEMAPGRRALRIELFDRIDPAAKTVLFDENVSVLERDVLEFSFIDQVVETQAEAGRSLFLRNSLGVGAGCRVCHSLRAGVTIVGPSLANVASEAGSRVPGMTAEEYLRQSIVDPNAYIVEGFDPNVMPQYFGETLTEDELDSLVAFLLTLE